MATQYYSGSDPVNAEGDPDICEATYLIIDSTSTQYVNFDDKHMEHETDNQESNIGDITKNSDDVVEALKVMELMDSTSNHTTSNEKITEKAQGGMNCMIKNNITVTTKDKKHNASQKTKEIVPPTSSRWFKTLNKAREILDHGTDIQADTIAKHLHEKHSHETYVESLCNITDANSLLFKEIDGMMQVTTTNGILQVPMDHFHSYKYSNNCTQCLLCHIIFLGTEADMHKYEVSHMNHVVKGIDHRGMRKIDYKYSHCIACNLKVRNRKEAKAHIKTPQHIQARKLHIKRNARKVAALGTDLLCQQETNECKA